PELVERAFPCFRKNQFRLVVRTETVLQIIAWKRCSAPCLLAGPPAHRQQLGTVLDPAIEKDFFVRCAQAVRSANLAGNRAQYQPDHSYCTGDATDYFFVSHRNSICDVTELTP